VVVNKERVVLGLLREEVSLGSGATVERVMRSGPTTFRPDVPVGKLAKRMRGAHTVLVTTSDGRLVGLLYRDDAERLASEQP
jgi:hypothetical protein